VSFYTLDEKRDKVNKVLSSLRFQEQYSGDRLAILLQGESPKLNSGDLLKLSFARAILTSKKTIILDNPFEGMDGPAIVCISEVLNKLKQKRTIILMAPSCPEVLHFDKKVIV
jgi:ABC-type multidrug transport system ATPase subunit